MMKSTSVNLSFYGDFTKVWFPEHEVEQMENATTFTSEVAVSLVGEVSIELSDLLQQLNVGAFNC